MLGSVKNNKFAWTDVIFPIESSLKSNSNPSWQKKIASKSAA
jgi:hypothetical protein